MSPVVAGITAVLIGVIFIGAALMFIVWGGPWAGAAYVTGMAAAMVYGLARRWDQ